MPSREQIRLTLHKAAIAIVGEGQPVTTELMSEIFSEEKKREVAMQLGMDADTAGWSDIHARLNPISNPIKSKREELVQPSWKTERFKKEAVKSQDRSRTR